ncbi:MAG: RNA polymerase sporulation sigma factor SigE [Clostridiales bacterium]|nr:RNA polymerase sporulation sigma factor SigE [Clostridiales bacterium]MCC8100203.1 RNA polymerase sporulation sigma factor SigE [Clostridiales bacterium]
MYQECYAVWRRRDSWSLSSLWQVIKRGWRKLLPRPNGIYYVGGSDLLPPLDRQEERRLLLALREGDEQARDTLIEHNLRLVVYLARRFENTGINLDDLVSIGTIGLIKAVNTFDTEKNIKLATYAARCIENEILMHLRKTSNQRTEISFDEPLNTDWDGNELLLSDILGTEEDLVERPVQAGEDRRLLYQAMEKLNEREKRIITMRFGLDGRDSRTQKEVADSLGISQSYISRLEKRIIGRLKKEFSRIG